MTKKEGNANIDTSTVEVSKSNVASLYRIALKELEKLEKAITKNKQTLEVTHVLATDYDRLQYKLQILESKHAHLVYVVEELKKALS
jgi:hypothetical protein